MKTLNQLWSDWKAQSRKNKINGIKRDFEVTEKDGKIYLTICGHAFAEMKIFESISDATRRLKEARDAALKYEGCFEKDENNEYKGL